MDKLRAAYRVAVLIGLVIMASLLVYAVIVGLFEKGTIAFPETPVLSGKGLELVKFTLLGVSIIIFFLIRFVNARILAAEGAQGKELGPRPRQLSGAPPEFQRLTTAAIITYVLCETPAIFGLVLFFLGRNASDFHLFLLISLFFFAVTFPKFSKWEEGCRDQTGRR